MDKQHLNLSIEPDLIAKARDMGLNISDELDKSLRDRLNLTDVQIDRSIEHCEFCNKPGEKETAKDVQAVTNTRDEVRHPDLLTWLWPDEKWICNDCLRRKCRRIL